MKNLFHKLMCKLRGHRIAERSFVTPIMTNETQWHKEWLECKCGHTRSHKEYLTGKRIKYPVYGAYGGLQLQYRESATA